MNNENHQIPGAPSPPAHAGGEQAAATSPPSGSPAMAPEPLSPAYQYHRIALVDLLDRLLAGGVVITGEVRLAIADVELVTVSLRALIASVSSATAHGPDQEEERAGNGR